jgi:hypothetical protein
MDSTARDRLVDLSQKKLFVGHQLRSKSRMPLREIT